VTTLLDSSVIIASFREKEDLHLIAKDILGSLGDFVVPDYVLAETLTVIKLREGFEEAKNCHEFLTSSEHISIRSTSPEEFEKALIFFMAHHNNLSFIDTLLMILHEQENFSITTFDKDLEKALS
jgi:predicted nucleic acid-binding protein